MLSWPFLLTLFVSGVVLLIKCGLPWPFSKEKEEIKEEEKRKESDEEWARRELGPLFKERNKERDKGKDIGK